MLQHPIGGEAEFAGAIDLIKMQAHFYEGENGENVVVRSIPANLLDAAQTAREKLLDSLSLFSEPMTERLLAGESIPNDLIWQTIRQATLSLELTPVLIGSAFKNKGVQDLLDAIERYLPSPIDREIVQAIDTRTGEAVAVTEAIVALAFKLTIEAFGQLTYMRLYAGTIKPGDMVHNTRTGNRVRIGQLWRMHANKREEVKLAAAGDIVALLGVDCASGDTFCADGNLSLESMFVPEPVITFAVSPKRQEDGDRLAKALNRFCKEDPTFRVSLDPESHQTLISGMGELHLEIYLERMKREYGAEVFVGSPAVAYRESIAQSAPFDYRLKKQTGGSGQAAHVVGRLEPCDQAFAFENRVVGGAIPKEFISSCEKGFRDAIQSGEYGYPVTGVKVVLTGGSYHPVDSSDLAFRTAAQRGFEQAHLKADPHLLEPIMRVEVETPSSAVGRIQGDLSARRGLLLGSQTTADYAVIQAEVPLSKMFGYSTTLRSLSAGMATFAMELACYRQAPVDAAAHLAKR